MTDPNDFPTADAEAVRDGIAIVRHLARRDLAAAAVVLAAADAHRVAVGLAVALISTLSATRIDIDTWAAGAMPHAQGWTGGEQQ